MFHRFDKVSSAGDIAMRGKVQGHVPIASLYSENGRKEWDARFYRLHEASLAGDIGKIKVLLDEDKLLFDRVLTSTSIKDNPLHLASHRGHADFVKEIIQQKPELAKELASQLNEQGQSPLHIAVARGHLSVVKELLKVEFDLCGIQDNPNGWTPIHVAVNKGTTEVIAELVNIASETTMLIRTYKGETLFHLAVKANRLDAIELLFIKFLSMGQEDVLNAFDCHGNTALHLAMAGAQSSVMTYLLSCESIDYNPINLLGFTPLDVLIYMSNHEKSIILDMAEKIQSGGGKHGKDVKGTSVAFLANSTISKPTRADSITRTSSPNKRKKNDGSILSGAGDNHGDAGILIVVATLVATVTYQSALNPPGGTIQLPYEKDDNQNGEWFATWQDPYPAGTPVLFWSLTPFFLLNNVALLVSVSIILLLLTGIPQKSMFIMKLLVSLMWIAVFCTLMAFLSVFDQIFIGIFSRTYKEGSGDVKQESLGSKSTPDDSGKYFKIWSLAVLYVWLGIFGAGSSWLSIRAILFLLRKANLLQGEMSNWITKTRELIRKLSQIGSSHKKVVCIILIICVVSILVCVHVVIYTEIIKD